MVDIILCVQMSYSITLFCCFPSVVMPHISFPNQLYHSTLVPSPYLFPETPACCITGVCVCWERHLLGKGNILCCILKWHLFLNFSQHKIPNREPDILIWSVQLWHYVQKKTANVNKIIKILYVAVTGVLPLDCATIILYHQDLTIIITQWKNSAGLRLRT